MNIESLEKPLQMLRKSGTVSGLCLARGREIIYNLFPFSEERVADFIGVIDDILLHYQGQNRHIDQMAFGFDGGNSVVVADAELRLVVFHMRDDEVDFIAKASRAFIVDYQTALAVIAMSEGRRPGMASPRPAITGVTEPVQPAADILQPGPPRLDPPALVIPPVTEPAPLEMAPLPAVPVSENESDFIAAPAAPVPGPASLSSPRPIPGRTTGRVAVANPVTRVAPALKPLRPVPPVAEPDDDGLSAAGRMAKLAPSQPESTLPPPRVPRVIRKF